jgi:hypothetical protein
VLVIGVQLAVRAWVGYAGFFNLDDYVFYTRAAQTSWHDADLLLTSYNGHLMPAAMLWVWLSTAASPLGFGTVVTTCLVLQVIVDVLLWRVLVVLFGSGWQILMPFVVFCCTTLTLPATLWWAAALNQLPQQIFMLLVVLAHLAHIRTGRKWYVALSVLALAFGLAFSEKTLLVVPLVLALTWLFLVEGTWWRALLTTLHRYWLSWLALAAVTMLYVVYYVTSVPSPARSGLGPADVLGVIDVSVRRTVLPGLVGGPWTWEPLGVVDSLAAPHPLAQVVAAAAVTVVVAESVRQHRGAGRAWALALGFLAVELVLLLVTRVQVVGVDAVAAEYRYFTDLATVVAIALGLAFIPLRLRPRRGDAFRLEPRPHVRTLVDRLPEGTSVAGVLAAAAALLLVSSAASATTYRERWAANPGRSYFANARSYMPQTTPDTVIYDGVVPTVVVWQLLWPANLPSTLFTPLGLEFTPLAEGVSTDRLMSFSADGHLQEAVVSGPAADPGAEPGCGWKVENGPTDIPMGGDLFSWEWVIHVRYDATSPGRMRVQAGGTDVSVPVRRGEHQLYLGVTGEVPIVTLTSQTPRMRVCTDDVVVGLPQPVEW